MLFRNSSVISSCGALKGISLAPRLRPVLPFQEITPAFVSFETLLSLITGSFYEGDPFFREAGCQGLDY